MPRGGWDAQGDVHGSSTQEATQGAANAKRDPRNASARAFSAPQVISQAAQALVGGYKVIEFDYRMPPNAPETKAAFIEIAGFFDRHLAK